jgi:hypothetical protein
MHDWISLCVSVLEGVVFGGEVWLGYMCKKSYIEGRVNRKMKSLRVKYFLCCISG